MLGWTWGVFGVLLGAGGLLDCVAKLLKGQYPSFNMC